MPPPAEQEGLVALVRPAGGPTGEGMPAGRVERILGDPDDPDVQFLCIAYEHGLRTEFPPAAAAEAETLPSDPGAADIAGRRDLRALAFVTIDGETARDFDDAVCLQPEPDGGVRLWVAIADVSHYVRPGSALDAEAAARGTSVYFPDRAIPMLPARLSTELCSLNPQRDRLVLVAELRYDRAGVRRAADVYRAVIRSRARLTYTEVAAILSATDTAEIRARRAALGALLPMLEGMRGLMRQLYDRRATRRLARSRPARGAGRPLRGRTHRRRPPGVAQRRAPRHRRAHARSQPRRRRASARARPAAALPDPRAARADRHRRVERAAGAVSGSRSTTGVASRRPTCSACSTACRRTRWPVVLSRQVLRALRQARYSTENAGHFGLAFPIYCHFTSPIRRYPDLLVHRQLGHVFDGEDAAAQAAAERLEAACLHSSQAERSAMEAERAMLDLKKCEFMLGHLLEPELATVVSVTKAGLFVELDAYPIEGLVRADGIPGDRWYFIEAERALKGMRTRQRYRLGDRMVVEATERVAAPAPDRLRHRQATGARDDDARGPRQGSEDSPVTPREQVGPVAPASVPGGARSAPAHCAARYPQLLGGPCGPPPARRPGLRARYDGSTWGGERSTRNAERRRSRLPTPDRGTPAPASACSPAPPRSDWPSR